MPVSMMSNAMLCFRAFIFTHSSRMRSALTLRYDIGSIARRARFDRTEVAANRGL
jgi:hypothetical protein